MNARPRGAVPLAAAVLGVLLVADSGAAPTAPPLCGTGPLNILLTNDDGWRAPGLHAMYDALRAAGHRVTVSAPDHNASGTAASFTWGSVEVVRDPVAPCRSRPRCSGYYWRRTPARPPLRRRCAEPDLSTSC